MQSKNHDQNKNDEDAAETKLPQQQPPEAPEQKFSRRKFLAINAAIFAGCQYYMLRQVNNDPIKRQKAIDQIAAMADYPDAKPTKFEDRPYIYERFCEMMKEAGLEGVELYVSPSSRQFANSLPKMPILDLVGNKIFIAQRALDTRTDREIVALLGHELVHLAKGKKHLLKIVTPEILSLTAGTAGYVAANKLLPAKDDASVSNDAKPEGMKRRGFLKRSAAIIAGLASAAGTEFVASKTHLRRSMMHSNEYEADEIGVDLSKDKQATISNFKKEMQYFADIGFNYDGSGTHPTFVDRIKHVESRQR